MISVQNIENIRKNYITQSTDKHKRKYSQYLTPASIAEFMVKIIPIEPLNSIRILDPGAGMGILAYTLLDKVLKECPQSQINIECYEIDEIILPYLKNVLNEKSLRENVKISIIDKDFIQDACFKIGFNVNCEYNYIIMNPPYKKIKSNSQERLLLRKIGIETVNFYTAFLSLAMEMVQEDGYISAIIPRSFCNGLYYLPFRKRMIERMKIRRIHLFNSRREAFKEDAVLQENIVMLLQKSKYEKDVIISSSEDHSFSNYNEFEYQYENIINASDEQKYIRIPFKEENSKVGLHPFKIEELGLSVSTGPIVDFRVNKYLEKKYHVNTIPLIYPVHVKNGKLEWPIDSKKFNAIRNEKPEISKSLFPKGNYIVIRRFSSKEEKRRINAAIITEADFVCNSIAIENHLNIIHANHKGIDIDLAYGLLYYLNTDYFDRAFREFSGHTQVNATDLKNLKYPSKAVLVKIGKIIGRKKVNIFDADSYIYQVLLNDRKIIS